MSDPVVAPAEPVGDAAVAVRIAGGSAAETLGWVRAAAAAVQAAGLAGVTDIVASPGRVTVAYAPLGVTDPAALCERVTAIAATVRREAGIEPVRHQIAVAYDGPDLEEVCGSHGISRAEFVAAHTAPDYLVEAIGFLPGFGYLAGLPANLATARRATPRGIVPAGSVGIGGGQTGVYPFASPGGWNLVGRSSQPLFDASRSRPALLEVGDHVRFIEADLPPGGAAPAAPPATVAARPTAITVMQPGLFTTIQDLGRPGYRAAGVPLSGAADRVSLRLANLLVGNPEDAAAIECTLLGPTLRFERDSLVALVGGAFPGLPTGVATRVPGATELTIGHATSGCRGYLAVAGGIDVALVLGSRSTLVVAGLGGHAGRPLRAGDRLAVGAAGGNEMSAGERGPRARARSVDLVDGPRRAATRVLRIIPGEHAEAFGGEAWARGFRASSR